jgi:hypothetical protein
MARDAGAGQPVPQLFVELPGRRVFHLDVDLRPSKPAIEQRSLGGGHQPRADPEALQAGHHSNRPDHTHALPIPVLHAGPELSRWLAVGLDHQHQGCAAPMLLENAADQWPLRREKSQPFERGQVVLAARPDHDVERDGKVVARFGHVQAPNTVRRADTKRSGQSRSVQVGRSTAPQRYL